MVCILQQQLSFCNTFVYADLLFFMISLLEAAIDLAVRPKIAKTPNERYLELVACEISSVPYGKHIRVQANCPLQCLPKTSRMFKENHCRYEGD